MLRLAFAVFVGLLLSIPALAQNVSLREGGFKEIWHPAANISGVLVTGVVRSVDAPQTRPKLAAYLPRDWAGEKGFFCTRVLTANGLYEAEADYVLTADWQGGIDELPFPEETLKRLTAKDASAVGVVVSKGECKLQSSVVSMAFWNGVPDGVARDVRILINSFGADEVYLFVGDDPAAKALGCADIAEAAKITTAFDLSCEVTLPPGGQTQIEINRVRSGSSEPPVFLTVLAQP